LPTTLSIFKKKKKKKIHKILG